MGGHEPWQRCLRNTSKKGMLMGRWVRLWSSIWPSTICSRDMERKGVGRERVPAAGTRRYTWRKSQEATERSAPFSRILAEQNHAGQGLGNKGLDPPPLVPKRDSVRPLPRLPPPSAWTCVLLT